jgi:transcriptional regulator with XRE-family HTH domain
MNRLQQLRLDRGLSLNELAAECRVGRNTIARIEQDGTAIHIEPLSKLAAFFGVPASSLLMPALDPERDVA